MNRSRRSFNSSRRLLPRSDNLRRAQARAERGGRRRRRRRRLPPRGHPPRLPDARCAPSLRYSSSSAAASRCGRASRVSDTCSGVALHTLRRDPSLSNLSTADFDLAALHTGRRNQTSAEQQAEKRAAALDRSAVGMTDTQFERAERIELMTLIGIAPESMHRRSESPRRVPCISSPHAWRHLTGRPRRTPDSSCPAFHGSSRAFRSHPRSVHSSNAAYCSSTLIAVVGEVSAAERRLLEASAERPHLVMSWRALNYVPDE